MIFLHIKRANDNLFFRRVECPQRSAAVWTGNYDNAAAKESKRIQGYSGLTF
jgi:hypothetical protein